MPTRRQFLKAGLAGALLLASAKVAWDVTGPGDRPGEREARARRVLRASVPVLLAGVIPAAGPERTAAVSMTVDGVVRAVAGFPRAVRDEIDELFILLTLPPTRILAAGLLSSWESASEASVVAFLERWRGSRFLLLQSGYQALNQLTLAAWYGNPGAWPAIGYGGPPVVAP